MMQPNSTRKRVKPRGDESREAEIRSNRLLRDLLRLIRGQIEAGGFFLWSSSPPPSLSTPPSEVLDILKIEGVYILEFHQCMFGLMPPEGYDNKQDVRVMKPAHLVTNILMFAKLTR